ncbi:MAG TPA: FtsX-like permease family protein [Candidatus Marinimicrobia bacterium]|nr:FtsX-like permease family protein [Candidatus Neomarinimicrobiota bacterium]
MQKKSHFKNTLKESLIMAIQSIRQNKLRSSLTLLGIAIGVFSVIGVMTAITTMESSIQSGLNVFGANTFSFQKFPAIHLGGHGSWEKYSKRKSITYDQYEKLRERVKTAAYVSANDDAWGKNIKNGDNQAKRNTALYAGDEWTIRTYNSTIDDGRNITHDDVHYARRVVILGGDALDQLFPFEYALGNSITIDGIKFLVIGTAERKGQSFGQSQDNYVIIPISTYLHHFAHQRTSLVITIESPATELYDKTQDEAIGIMRTIRKVPPGEENDFEVISNVQLLETFSSFTSGVKAFAFVISIIALFVAGIGIMNIMLVSVTERTKEIGIRKAIGANKRDIITQFLAEAVFLSEIGGIVGVILGVVGGNVVAMMMNIPAVIPMDWVVYGLVVCSFIGIGFGIYPAWRAANLDPIESLRFE